ncbi:chorismate-binding protein [Flavobacterium taihuense]|uniref:Chorismate-binding protein n=1 Tax=Flavobacterium taihuense TaxID=2857508 RepID=A0ABS6Y329_9FLAO|nr:chorismate-binding protein [Flavobacterium taihuense]MBW4362478.1 chorismate-binding protein [Flavobacterium taihuense]
MSVFFEKVMQQQKQKLPFVLYCKPNSDTIIGMFQHNDTLFDVIDFTEKGFVFASFDGNCIHLIPEKQSETLGVIWEREEIEISGTKQELSNVSEKNNFESIVAKGIQSIENQELKKVVLSRKEIIELDNFDLVATFKKMVQLYPTAFVYCFCHPKVGIWMGATPEQLVKANVNVFETMALAGTQKDYGSEEIVWEKKEREEQQYVTDYIVDQLKEVALEVSVTEPYSVKAGSVWHLKTDVWGVLNEGFSLKQVAYLLHPTPAVCGLPKEVAKAFILKNENYDRTFYTGFLGELNTSFALDSVSSALFVNLRCMQIRGSQAHLYMGCGITKDSIPENEWMESVNKSMTMKKVL